MKRKIRLGILRCDIHSTAHSKNGTLHSPPIGDPEFMPGGAVILKLFRKMVQTGKPVIPYLLDEENRDE
tara:strand:- start:473 stop:679 length:207 start_codon:yes stop_codon:yes gene_type:complete